MTNRTKVSKELTLKVPWGKVAAVAWGSPENPPVLVVHGTLDNAGSFTRLIQLLPDYYYVAIDLPGHGFSSHFPTGMLLNYFDYILVIKYVLDELHWQHCTYMGHSFGGQLGVMFSIIFPGRLERIITFDALLPKIINNSNLLATIKHFNDTTLTELNKKPSPLYTKDQVLEALHTRRQFKLNTEAVLALFDRAVTRVGDDKYKYNRDLRMRSFVFPLFNKDQYIELLKYFNVPTLLIFATDSWFELTNESDHLEYFKKLLPNNCETVTIEGNHDLHNNNPERVVSHILTFLNKWRVKSKL